MKLPTFGFELEFDTRASDVVSHLYHSVRHEDDDVIGSDTLHSYHCGCEYCDFDSGYPLRGQTDSSCSGELISHPMKDIAQAAPLFEAIQEAAFEVDAEPGLRSGLHVHVGVGDIPDATLARFFYDWLKWEPVFGYIARGRFLILRDFNASNRRQLRQTLAYMGFNTWEDCADLSESDKYTLYAESRNCDRHALLSTYTRHGTWEFRIWNSTRTAWRMILSTQLSRIFMTTEFHDVLDDFDPADVQVRDAARDLLTALRLIDNDEVIVTANLLERQLDWQEAISDDSTKYVEPFTLV